MKADRRMSKKKHDIDMTRGPIWRHLLNFALPLCVGLVFQQLYNTVDTIVVGRFVGKEALAAVGTTGMVINMLVALGNGFSSGATILISQHYGAGNEKRLSDAVQTTILVTVFLSMVITALGLLLVDPMLRLMATPEDVYDMSRQYLTIYYSGIAGLLFYNMGSGIMRAVGDSRRPLYFLILSALLNTVLDVTFVRVFHMGVAGVGYATIIAQAVSAILILIALTKTDAIYRIRWRKLLISGKELKKILSIGLPTAIQQSVTSFSNVFVQSYINILGSTFMAGWSTYGKLDGYVILPLQALVQATSTFVGQNYGAKNVPRARKGVRTALSMSEGITIFLGVLVWIFAPQLMHVFTDDEEVIYYAVNLVRTITPFYVFMNINQILAGGLRGIGKSIFPTIAMLSSFVAFRQIYLFILKGIYGGTPAYYKVIYFAYPAAWAVCSILMLIFYFRSALGKRVEPAEKA